MNIASSLRRVAGLSMLPVLLGCASTPARPAHSPEQLSAIQTREIDAPPDAAFRAAAGVMMDSGMVISMSDYAAGLLSGATWGYVAGVNEAQRTELGGVLVWIHRGPTGRTAMRVSFALGSGSEADLVSKFASQVEERVMLASAPRRATR